MLKGIAMALRLMKTIDRIVIGPAAKYLWPEMRKRRYKLMNPAKAAYLMLPHLNLAPEVRRAVILEEMEDGRAVWSDMTTTINGKEVTVSACRELGRLSARRTPDRAGAVSVASIEQHRSAGGDEAAEAKASAQMEPVLEQQTVTAEYRVTKTNENAVSFTPVQRVRRHGGGLTELANLQINLHNENLRRDFGSMKIGDEKEFTLGITVVTGYRRIGDEADAAAEVG